MRIAIICRRYHPEIGGTETHVKEIAERIARKHDVVVFTLVKDKRSAKSEIINGVSIRRFSSLAISYALEVPPNSLLMEVEKFNPHIIHSHNAHTSIPYFASKAKHNSRFVITPHYQGIATTAFRRVLALAYKPLLKSAFSKADKIICVSSAERDMLCTVYPIDQQKIRVVPNGVGSDILTIIPKNGQQRESRILSVARFDLHHKKTDKLIKAFKILESKIDAKLVLVGSGPDKEQIVRIIRALKLEERVELKSNLTREELISEYARASIFVTASEQEAFGIAVAEALAAKLQVIVPNCTGLSSFVRAGYALGLEVPITPEKVAQAIISCMNESKQTVEYSPYTWDMAAKELEAVYEELIGKDLDQYYRNTTSQRN